jgi:hypothetical protein
MTLALVVHKIRVSFKGGWKHLKEKHQRILKEPISDYGKAWGFLDGACQGAPNMCGEGVHFFESSHYLLLKHAAD